ncbi:MAG TPA: GNAT family N-acetyltransferase, partial [Thermodesulfobacteriota bacterium]|nr:GNAT family N-acetyltransferase [Thermodesulfobacteriota bacterium]
MSLSFRTAGEGDREFVRSVSAAVFSIYGDYEETLPRWLLDPWVVTVIAEEGGEPAGFAMLQFGPRGIWENSLGELLAIAVNPDRQGEGVGKALLNCVEDLARHSLLKRIQLHTAETNTAGRALFQSMGYR